MKEGFVTYKQMSGFEGRYLISDQGDVVSLWGKKVRFIKPTNNRGYVKVTLSPKGSKKYKNFTVHRLVAEHFLDKEERYNVVHHVNANRKDNRVVNLRWVSSLINNNEAHKNKDRYGVHFRKDNKMWRAKIYDRSIKRERNLGQFSSKEEAQSVFNKVYFEINGFYPMGEK